MLRANQRARYFRATKRRGSRLPPAKRDGKRNVYICSATSSKSLNKTAQLDHTSREFLLASLPTIHLHNPLHFLDLRAGLWWSSSELLASVLCVQRAVRAMERSTRPSHVVASYGVSKVSARKTDATINQLRYTREDNGVSIIRSESTSTPQTQRGTQEGSGDL